MAIDRSPVKGTKGDHDCLSDHKGFCICCPGPRWTFGLGVEGSPVKYSLLQITAYCRDITAYIRNENTWRKPAAQPVRPAERRFLAKAFFAAADEIPEPQRTEVVKAALAVIRDELKSVREKVAVAKAKAKGKAGKAATPAAGWLASSGPRRRQPPSGPRR